VLYAVTQGRLGASFAPAKTPQSIVDRLSREIKQASTHPKFIAALAPPGSRSSSHPANWPRRFAQIRRNGAM